ncbi:MAG: hypothetical protein ACE5IH_09330 [Thermodesulfobacteriota bacterium]
MYNMYNNLRVVILSLVLLFSSISCGTGAILYVNPEADFSYIKKVAILPFNNLSEDKFAGERVRSAVTVDVLSRGVFEIMEQGEVSRVTEDIFRRFGFEEGQAIQLDKEMIRMIGENLGVQALLIGSVDEYMGGMGQGSTVSISLRMVDSGSATILWQVNTSATSLNMPRKILGIEEIDRAKLTRRAVKEAIDTLL